MIVGRQFATKQPREGFLCLYETLRKCHMQKREQSDHIPVLQKQVQSLLIADEVMEQNSVQYYVDGTVGCGGHAKAILLSSQKIRLLCIDRDPSMLSIAENNLKKFADRVYFQEGSYADMALHLNKSGFPSTVSGILVDLGANSHHFDNPERGFSYLKDGPLDMRFNPTDPSCESAADFLARASEVDLTHIFQTYGEERLAKEFAKAIVRERDACRNGSRVFQTTSDLSRVIKNIAEKWTKAKKSSRAHTQWSSGYIGSLSRCFQALRIHVNKELDHVQHGIPSLADQLAPFGRLVTLAFHSLEDRPIKQLFRSLHRGDITKSGASSYESCSRGLLTKKFRILTNKAIQATSEEVASNSGARSARLRCLERYLLAG